MPQGKNVQRFQTFFSLLSAKTVRKLQTIFQKLMKRATIFINVSKSCLQDIFCVRDYVAVSRKLFGLLRVFTSLKMRIPQPPFPMCMHWWQFNAHAVISYSSVKILLARLVKILDTENISIFFF